MRGVGGESADTMVMMRTTIAVLGLSLAGVCQNPAPAGEGKVVWTADESQAFAYVQELVRAWREGRECMDWRREQATDLPGYSVAKVEWRDGETVVTSGRTSRRMFRPGHCLVYLTPSKSGSDSRRAFCVRGDGVAAFTDNSENRSWSGEHQFLPNSVFGAGGEDALTDFPRMPARGQDGNFWQPTSMLRPITVNVMVVDDDGEPMSMRSLMCVPAEPEHRVPHALPAGTLLTTIEGNAKLAGMPATGMGFALRNGGYRRMWIPSANVAVRGHAVRITVSRELLRRQAMNANESAAIATLKNISSAQSQCQASGVIDVDQNGQGEYGMFAELSGRMVVRGGTKAIVPPVLSAAFGNVQDAMVARSGYYFRMFLPGKAAVPVPESAQGGVKAAAIDTPKAEVLWCCYAWPAHAGESGQRAFFIDQSGDVLAAPNADGAYSGRDKAPSGNDARVGAGGMAAAPAANRQGVDKQDWRVVH